MSGLEREVERLRDRVAELEELVGLRAEFPSRLGLTHTESMLFGLLVKRGMCTRDAIYAAMYGTRPDGDQPEMKIIDAYVCKIRRKLAARRVPVKIECAWGRGYYLDEASRAAAKALVIGGAP
ncbi:MAG: helix-turn-helix domain-containing protein [Burkholderiales bacterium]|nr:helix-turn-helix domain-containing protein [Burkholderiales bacterium]